MSRYVEIFLIALRLGCIAFGGPAAHIGFFKEEYVERKKWLTDARFAELVSITQFLPGPGSSQLGAAIGYIRGRWMGGFLAWLGFTLPSALLLIIFAIGVHTVGFSHLGWLKGLGAVALAVVANAVVSMHTKLCEGYLRKGIALFTLVLLMIFPMGWMQPVVILVGGCMGAALFHDKSSFIICSEKKGAQTYLFAFVSVVLVVLIPFFLQGNEDLETTGGIFSAGSLVFGGGHVVLPLLGSEVVASGRMSQSEFMAGYGMTQAMPGPVFTFAGYIGAKLALYGNVWLGGAIAIAAVFLPGMILLAGFLPVWDRLKQLTWATAAIQGANAAVVGLLAHTLYHLVQQSELSIWWEWVIVVICFLILFKKLIPVWLLVLFMACLGMFLF